ncbi:MAG: ArsR/SmtB family transcription factor [Ruminococcus sp.]
METDMDVSRLSEEFKGCQKVLTALGDEVRQHLMLVMILSGECYGLRVGDIASKTNLSRPAVSHHLQILKNAGIVKMRREGTKNYYYFDADMTALDNLINMLKHAKKIMQKLPDRSGDE